ncbi:MAG: zinc-binding dehydrogenase, partial [Kitasatospora sp.]|nr:zinc-binding dehydrogenase [Kitasatospora sp.]
GIVDDLPGVVDPHREWLLHHHVATRADLVRRTGELFDLVRDGRLTQRITGRYPLADAARAHADLESRRTTGKLLLLP